MEFTQKRIFDTCRFTFESQFLRYFLKDRSGSRSFAIPYLDIDPGARYEMQERNEYFRNVGFMWLILATVFVVLRDLPAGLLWGGLGLFCLCIYYFMSTRYIVVPSSQALIYVMNDAQAPDIIDEMLARYKEAVMSEYGQIDYSRTFEEEKRKYRTFLTKGVIDDPRFSEILKEMEEHRDRFSEGV
jgi:hypothetical protein